MTSIDNVLENYIVYSNQYDDTILAHLNDGEVYIWSYSDIPTLAEIVAKAHGHAAQRTTAAIDAKVAESDFAADADEREFGIAEAVHGLLMSDAMTGNDEGTPSGYYVAAENVEYLVRTVVDAYNSAREPDAHLAPCSRCGDAKVYNPRPTVDLVTCQWCAYEVGAVKALEEAAAYADRIAHIADAPWGALDPEDRDEWRDSLLAQVLQGRATIGTWLRARAARLREQG